MKSQVETYIPKALKACRELLIEENTKNVKKEYDGYAAALGMNIINAGLLTAISFYTDIHRKAEEKAPKRFKILKAIVHILNDDGFNISNEDNGLLNYLIIENNNNPINKRKIIDASIALKLALRNFNHIK